MTFLQPLVLWGLPLVLLPIIIHLLNRMRHRPQSWAAMRFLVTATRSSVNNARLRQWLILLLRVCAVLMLILFVSRPLAGGWLGWALSPAPDTILLLLDRSASMETRVPEANRTKREQALQALAQSARQFEESSHLVLIDSASRAPQTLAKASTLLDSPLTTATDTAADIPGLFAAALAWLVENRAGTAELWVASDLQRTSWQPEDPRWQSLLTQLNALPQKVQVRLLALNRPGPSNRSVSVKEFVRRMQAGQSELQFALDIQSSAAQTETIPLSVALDGTRTQRELKLEGQALRWRHKLRLGDGAGQGWGSFELPADGNNRDNTAYFVYGAQPPLRATIVAPDAAFSRFLQLALSAGAGSAEPVATLVTPATLSRAAWDDHSLLVWKEPLPSGASAQRLRTFAEEGGALLFLPPGRPDAQRFEGVAWGEVEDAATEKPFRILRWNEDEGPLAKSDEGISLPLAYTSFQRRQALAGPKTVLAAFDDGSPFLVRQTLGRGEIYFCASLPDRDWSSLAEGPVLVPMMQRLLQSGSRRLQQASSIQCGDLSTVDQGLRWEAVESAMRKEIRTQAGVYRTGERLLAVNRPKTEDDPEVVDPAETERLFGAVGVHMLQEQRRRADQLQGEVWRMFAFAMLLFLIGEGMLILPSQAASSRGSAQAAGRPGPREPEPLVEAAR